MQLGRLYLKYIAVFLVCAWSAAIPAQEISGRVVGIADGDSFTLLTADNRQVKIRLAEIDAPERRQPYGSRAREQLSRLIFQEKVIIDVQTVDRYGRTVGRPYKGDLDVCAEMVRTGAAWLDRQYLRDDGLLAIERDARKARRGVWGLSESDNQPPWEWRRSGGKAQGPNGCTIKGNIGSGGTKIYHVPGMSSYAATRIDASKGERWFCSEEAAVAAGWRAPRN